MNNIIAYIDGKISVYEKQTTENLGSFGFDKIQSDHAWKMIKTLEEIKHFIKNEFLKVNINENS
jgi:hypothetical protein